MRHDLDEEQTIAAMLTTGQRAYDNGDDEYRAYHCVHGSYVGFQRALAYRCEFCDET